MPTLIQQKEQNATKYIKKALVCFKEANYEDALSHTRLVLEAFCKGLIAQLFNEVEASEIFMEDRNKIIKRGSIPGDLSLADMIFFLERNEKLIKHKRIVAKIREIKEKTVDFHHDPNDVAKVNIVNDHHWVMHTLIDLIRSWEIFFRVPQPAEFDEIINKLAFNTIEFEEPDEWKDLYDFIGGFNNSQNYVLVLPPNNMELTEAQMSAITRIPWSLVFDYNPQSKASGIFSVQEKNKGNRIIRPITIKQKSDSSLLTIDRYSINWVFANGLSSIPETIATTLKEWKIQLNYPKFLAKIITEYHNAVSAPSVVIFLNSDQNYIGNIFDAFTEIIQEQKLRIAFIAENMDSAEKLNRDYDWYQPLVSHMRVSQFVRGVASVLSDNNNADESKIKLIPSRTSDSQNDVVDISEHYIFYLSEGLEILYFDIELQEQTEDGNFYTGSEIAWSDIPSDLDVKRNVYEKLEKKLLDALKQPKGARRITLIHKPGSGGTTLSRRIAFNLHRQYPTILLDRYQRNRTINSIKDISELSQQSILLIVEAYKVNENDIGSLILEINKAKKNVVILYVKRSHHRDASLSVTDVVDLSDKMLDLNEMSRFIKKYTPLAVGDSKNKLMTIKDEPLEKYLVIDYPLITFEKAFSPEMLFNYIYSQIKNINSIHSKFLGFIAIIYHYTQKSVNENWFSSLFIDLRPSEEIEHHIRTEYSITKLAFRELDREGYSTSLWRPKYNVFAAQILTILVGGQTEYPHRSSWKDNLHSWILDMLKSLHETDPILTNDIKNLLKSLLLERDNSDTIVTDSFEFDGPSGFHQFSKCISDIADPAKQKMVFIRLCECFPDEPHFLGHLGRFIYEKATTHDEFSDAYNYINQALQLGQNDYSLWHIHGMCNKKKIDFLIKQFNTAELLFENSREIEYQIQDLSNTAQESFKRSREINQLNLHSHTAEIFTILRVLDFGKFIHQVDTTLEFLTDTKYEWYQDKFEQMSELLNETRELITLTRDLENKASLLRSRGMLDQCEAKMLTFMEDFPNASEKILKMISAANRESRPYFRKLFILAKLASRKRGHSGSLNDAWDYLTEHDLQIIQTNIENSIQDAPGDWRNYRDWLKTIRCFSKSISVDDAINKLRSWREVVPQNELGFHQASYYLYVLHAINALNRTSELSNLDAISAKNYMEESVTPFINDGVSFEWLGHGVGVKQMVNISSLGKLKSADTFFNDTTKLKRVRATISKISSPQNGLLVLAGGLEAFFVPVFGKFVQHRDETTEVECFIGFRYGSIQAWQVTRIGGEEKNVVQEVVTNSIESVSEKEKSVNPVAENDETRTESPKYKYITGLKILGKIELDSSEDDRKKKNRK